MTRCRDKPVGMALQSFRQAITVVAAALWIAADSSALAQSRADDLWHAKVEYVLKSSVFTAKARNRAVHFIETISPGAEAMTREQFLLCLLRIAAFADNGHDSLHDVGGAWWPEGRLPIRMIWFPSGWVIARTNSANADILGARVESIEGLSSKAMFRHLRDLAGGTDPYRRWNLEPIIEKAGLLHAAGLARYPDRVTLRLRLKNGEHLERSLFFVPNRELPPGQWFERIWSPTPWPGEAEKGWRAVDPQPTPLYLQEGEHLFRVVPLPELDALYLQMRVHFDADGQTVADFRRSADQAIEVGRPRNLIVDLRFDTGGDIDQTRNWQRELVGRVPGLVYVLVAPYTFSAGIVSAAAFKHDASDRARIVGEDVGDRLRWWSEGEDVCLPTSRYCFHLTTGQWDLVHGCAGQPDCYGDRYDARVNNLRPNLYAPLTPENWLAGADPGMEAIERDIGRSSPQRQLTSGAAASGFYNNVSEHARHMLRLGASRRKSDLSPIVGNSRKEY